MWGGHLRARPADVRALELEGVALDEDLGEIWRDMGEIWEDATLTPSPYP